MDKTKNQDTSLETANAIMGHVNALLTSNANPSDETSLSIRLSLIKVGLLIKLKQYYFLYLKVIY